VVILFQGWTTSSNQLKTKINKSMIRESEMQLALDKIEQLELKLESANSRIISLENYVKQLEKWKDQHITKD
jgi:predicted RNase H-like nuclease (RuvC/YqgF family)